MRWSSKQTDMKRVIARDTRKNQSLVPGDLFEYLRLFAASRSTRLPASPRGRSLRLPASGRVWFRRHSSAVFDACVDGGARYAATLSHTHGRPRLAAKAVCQMGVSSLVRAGSGKTIATGPPAICKRMFENHARANLRRLAKTPPQIGEKCVENRYSLNLN